MRCSLSTLTPSACKSVIERFQNDADFVALMRQETICKKVVVRGYYRTWSRLTYVRKSPATSGTYAARGWVFKLLEKKGAVYADDKFIRLSVQSERRTLVTDEFYTTHAQTSIQQLINDRARYNVSHRAVSQHMKAIGSSDDVARWSPADV